MVMEVYFLVVGTIFIPICLSAWVRRYAAWLDRRSKPVLPPLRKRLLPKKAWCAPSRTIGEHWRN